MYHQVGCKTGLPRRLANLILSHLETPLNKLRTADTHPGEAHRVFVFAMLRAQAASALEGISRPDGLDEFVIVDDAVPVSVEAGDKPVDLLG